MEVGEGVDRKIGAVAAVQLAGDRRLCPHPFRRTLADDSLPGGIHRHEVRAVALLVYDGLRRHNRIVEASVCLDVHVSREEKTGPIKAVEEKQAVETARDVVQAAVTAGQAV